MSPRHAAPPRNAIDTPPLGIPYRNAPPLAALTRFVRKYFTFCGRAGRSEFWWPTALVFVVSFAIDPDTSLAIAAPDWVSGVFGVATLIPSLAVAWRRLHDTDRSGSWIFIAFLPVVGWVWLAVLLLSPPDPAGARYDRPYVVPREERTGSALAD